MINTSFTESNGVFVGCSQNTINSIEANSPNAKNESSLMKAEPQGNPFAALRASDDFSQENLGFILGSSTSEVQNLASEKCVWSQDRPQDNNSLQILSNEKVHRSTLLNSLHAYPSPNGFKNDAFTIPFCYKSDLEDDSKGTSHSYESDHSSMSQLDEMVFPSFLDKSPLQTYDCCTGSRQNENTPLEIKRRKTNVDCEKQLEKSKPACLPENIPFQLQNYPERKGEKLVSSGHSKTSNETIKNSQKTMGANFQPSNWDVIIGRGKDAYDHIGNRRFKIIVAMHLREYADSNQVEKFHLVERIVKQIREASPNAGFVKKDAKGNWHTIDTEAVQHKVARTFRDSMIGLLRCNAKFSSHEKSRNVIEAQNAIFKSCQIRFSAKDVTNNVM